MDDPVWSSTTILSLEAILDWACGDATSRRGVLREAVISACKNRKIKYKLQNEFIATYLTDDTVNDTDLLIFRESFEKWYHETCQHPRAQEKPLDSRSEKSYQFLIAIMLKILVTDDHGMKKFNSQDDLRNFIEEKYPSLNGLSYENLGRIFSKANKILQEHSKKK
uniref:hypothetical protein n=1 Tax=Candidatus Electrothrix sp. TaxID=2170559 RepID=UPI0040569BD2